MAPYLYRTVLILIWTVLSVSIVTMPTKSAAQDTDGSNLSAQDFLALVQTNLSKFPNFRVVYRSVMKNVDSDMILDEFDGTWSHRSDGDERLEIVHSAGGQAGRHEVYTLGPETLRSLVDFNDGTGTKGGFVGASRSQTKFQEPGMPRRFFLLPHLLDRGDFIRKSFRFEGTEVVAGRPCLKVSYLLVENPSDSNLNYRETYWLDTERSGQVLQFEWEQGGRVLARMSDVELHEVGQGLWFPTYCRIDYWTQYSGASVAAMAERARVRVTDANGNSFNPGKEYEDHTATEIRVPTSSIEFDVELNDDVFNLKFPIATRVNDTIAGKQYYQGGVRPTASGTPTPPPTAETLDEIVAKGESQRHTLEASSLERSRWGFWTICLTAGVSALLIACAILIRARRAG